MMRKERLLAGIGSATSFHYSCFLRHVSCFLVREVIVIKKLLQLAEMAGNRAFLYRMLASLYLREVCVEQLKAMSELDMQGVMKDMGLDLSGEFYQHPVEQVVEELAVEYCRLFIGPGIHFPPYESVYAGEFVAGGGIKGLLWGEAAVEVNRFIRECGLEFDASYRGLPDHLGVELDLMGQLAAWEASAWSEGDAGDARMAVELQSRFMKDHLVKWVPDYCQQLAGAARVPFYREMSLLTKDFIMIDMERIEELLRLDLPEIKDKLSLAAEKSAI
ncbi:hypothetical protein SY88_17950 [Clostridiales bacterium PH28_bin88]|nr:hypothetical protein SY88_17950 [Clostridiales bacterium PH28_bin88]